MDDCIYTRFMFKPEDVFNAKRLMHEHAAIKMIFAINGKTFSPRLQERKASVNQQIQGLKSSDMHENVSGGGLVIPQLSLGSFGFGFTSCKINHGYKTYQVYILFTYKL